MINIRDKKLLKDIGERIKKLRNEKGISQEELGFRSELGKNQVGKIERGENNPTICTLYAIARGLEVAIEMITKDI